MAVTRRRFLALLLVLPLAVACGRSDDRSVEVTSDGTAVPSPAAKPTATATSTPEPIALSPTPPPSRLDPEDPRGFSYPIADACLPGSDRLMPNAVREYRNGFHEGIDWYDLAGCASVGEGTPVLAMYGGVVVRADRDYEEITAQQVADLAARTAQQGFSDDDTLDSYRGRQIWIDHGNGIVTRYAHLLSIEEGIDVGVEVRRGQPIGEVGESGTPESVTDPGTENHLHAEVRVGDSFLGDSLPLIEVRALYETLFGPEAGEAASQDEGYDEG